MFWESLTERWAAIAVAADRLAVVWLIQSSLLILVGVLGARLFRRKGAAIQSAIYRTTLAIVLICPAISLAFQSLGVPCIALSSLVPTTISETLCSNSETPSNDIEDVQPQDASIAGSYRGPMDPPGNEPTRLSSASEHAAKDYLSARGAESTEIVVASPIVPLPREGVRAAQHSVAATPTDWLPIAAQSLTIAWLAASVVLMIRLAVSCRSAAFLRRTACAADAETVRMCRAIAERLDIGAPPVLRSPFVASPMLVGVCRPAILLPEDDGKAARCKEVLVHELAHLARRDVLWNFVARLGTAVFFFQPLLWYLARRLTVSSEEVCDDFVVRLGFDRPTYARRLVEIVERHRPMRAAGVGVISIRSTVGRRIDRILDSSRRISTRLGRRAVSAVAVASLAVACMAGMLAIGAETQELAAAAAAAPASGLLTAGEKAPPFTVGTGSKGRPLSLSDYRGRVVLLVFCEDGEDIFGPVSRDDVETFYDELRRDARFAFIGLSKSEPPLHNGRFGGTQRGIGWSHGILGESKPSVVARAYGVEDRLAWFLIGTSGTIVESGAKLDLDRLRSSIHRALSDAKSSSRSAVAEGSAPGAIRNDSPTGVVADNPRNNVAGSYTGQVVDVSGKGIVNATLTSDNPSWAANTDSEGRFTLPILTLGQGMIVKVAAAGFCTREHVRIFYARGYEDSKIQLYRPARISGRILGSDGKPLARAPVALDTNTDFVPQEDRVYSFRHRAFEAVSDDGGNFTIDNVPPGDHFLSYPGFAMLSAAPIKDWNGYVLIRARDGEQIDGQVLDLSQSTCAVEGRVIGPDGKPLPGGFAYLNLAYLISQDNTVAVRRGTCGDGIQRPVDSQGRFRIEHLPPGDWELSLWHPRHQRHGKREVVSLSASDRGKTVTRDIRVFDRYEPQAKLARDRAVMENAGSLALLREQKPIPFYADAVDRNVKKKVLDLVNLSVNSPDPNAPCYNTPGLVYVHFGELGLDENLPTERLANLVAVKAHAGELYFSPPNTLVTINGTILVKCKLPEKANPEENDVARLSRLTHAKLQDEIDAVSRKRREPGGARVNIKEGDWLFAVRDDGRGFFLVVRSLGQNDLHVETYYAGRFHRSGRPVLP